jgi:hypothetical protein
MGGGLSAALFLRTLTVITAQTRPLQYVRDLTCWKVEDPRVRYEILRARTAGLAELYWNDAPMVLPLEVSTMLEQDEDKTRAPWRDHQRMLCGIHHTPKAKPKPVKRGSKIAPRTSSRQLRKRSRAMRSIAPSSCAE